MEIKEFAEIVLFNDDVYKDKLFSPKIFTDDFPGCAIIAPKFPARSQNLIIKEGHANKRVSFPNLNQLENDTHKGILLHFFANHELLALEIMALFLLTFPHAPKKMRMGVVQTMLEEQKHLNLYLGRMGDFQISFGDVSVNDFFWKHLSQMKSEIDFFVKMSMTFEQANIDYAFFYKEHMKKIGDTKTAQLLEDVYNDEIGHVKHGVTWFNKLKPETQNQWEAYVNHIQFPLTPARAKGFYFHEPTRILCGLEEQFIRELKIWGGSKGRSPNVFYFNPDCENENERSNLSYTSNIRIKKLQNDLSHLGLFLVSDGDVLLTQKKPSKKFLEKMAGLGFNLCDWHETEKIFDSKIFNDSAFPHKSIGHIFPWGWSPKVLNKLEPLHAISRAPLEIQNKLFTDKTFYKKIQPLFSKAFACILNKLIYEKLKDTYPDVITPEKFLPIVAFTKEQVSDSIKKFSSFSGTVLLRSPFSTSGQKMLRISNEHISTTEWNTIQNILEVGNGVTIEPWYTRIADFSLLTKVAQKTSTTTITRILNNEKGAYQGSLCGKIFLGLKPKLIQDFHHLNSAQDSIFKLFDQISSLVQEACFKTGYEGPLGIDCFVYSDPKAKHGFRLKPLSEINPRFTMGMVAAEISKKILPHRPHLWFCINIEKYLQGGEISYEKFSEKLENLFPIQFCSSQSNMIEHGIIITSDPVTSKSLLTFSAIGNEVIKGLANIFKEYFGVHFEKIFQQIHIHPD